MPAAQPTAIMTTITNTGRDAVVYVPCGEIVYVSAASVGPPWRSGRNLPNPAMIWKTYLLDHQGLKSDDRYVLFFVDGQDGASSGCGDVAHVTSLGPGRTVHERQRWDGFAFRHLARRDRTGRGSHFEVTMVEGALSRPLRRRGVALRTSRSAGHARTMFAIDSTMSSRSWPLA